MNELTKQMGKLAIKPSGITWANQMGGPLVTTQGIPPRTNLGYHFEQASAKAASQQPVGAEQQYYHTTQWKGRKGSRKSRKNMRKSRKSMSRRRR
jgi:hypothetical protein